MDGHNSIVNGEVKTSVVSWENAEMATDCLIWKNMERVLESRCSKYIEARSAAYYQVSTKLASKKHVDMKRAKSDLEEHQLICLSVANMSQSGPPTLIGAAGIGVIVQHPPRPLSTTQVEQPPRPAY